MVRGWNPRPDGKGRYDEHTSFMESMDRGMSFLNGAVATPRVWR
jgi:hypothetical protein